VLRCQRNRADDGSTGDSAGDEKVYEGLNSTFRGTAGCDPGTRCSVSVAARQHIVGMAAVSRHGFGPTQKQPEEHVEKV
jgi:hypothetical protein